MGVGECSSCGGRVDILGTGRRGGTLSVLRGGCAGWMYPYSKELRA